MVVEYTRYQVDQAGQDAFGCAYTEAQASLRDSSQCVGWELSRATEEPSSYILRIEWDSADGHMLGFRGSPASRTFFDAVRPYVYDVLEMRHYEATGVRG